MSIFKKAERSKAKLRLSVSGPAGSGKTYSALRVAFGLGNKVVLIDSENGSGSLYSSLGDYDIFVMEKPYEPEKLINVIKEAEKEKYDVIIIDSLTHYWAGEGGLLERHEKIGGNSYTAWAKVTPVYQKMMETILQSKCHIIFTMRSKQDYVLTEKNGKQVPEKVGMAPIMRDGAEYEVTVAINLNMHHLAETNKDRTGLFDSKQWIPSEETGRTLLEWLESGAEPPKPRLTDSQRKQMFAMSKQAGMTVDGIKEHIHTTYSVESSNDLTIDQAEDLISWLDDRISEHKEAANE